MAGVSLLGICGSTRKSSLNHALLHAVRDALPDGATLTLYGGLDQLPIFNQDLPEPAGVLALKAQIAASDGIVFAIPEYNYSVPGGLKNALDWVSSPAASSPMRGKPIGICGAASGMSGTIRAQAHLRQMLVFSDSPCMNQPEVLIPRAHERFDADGKLVDPTTHQLVTRFATALVSFVERYRALA